MNPQVGMGAFAVLPDHVALGAQAAELVFEAQDNGWQLEERVEQPLSVNKIANARHMKEFLGVEREGLGSVDKLLE